MKTKSQKLEILKKKQEQIKAQIQRVEASEKTRQRKQETRRKILVGAYYFDKTRSDNSFSELAKLMDGYLKRESDRELFDLNPLPEKEIPLTNE